MKTIDTLQSMATYLPPDLCQDTAAILSTLTGYFDGKTIDTVSFTQLWDYPIYLVETLEDLAIIAIDGPAEGPAPSLLAAPCGAFDIARWTKDEAYAVLGTIMTDLGGPQYVIPKAIADLCPNVAESIRMAQTQPFGSAGNPA